MLDGFRYFLLPFLSYREFGIVPIVNEVVALVVGKMSMKSPQIDGIVMTVADEYPGSLGRACHLPRSAHTASELLTLCIIPGLPEVWVETVRCTHCPGERRHAQG